MSVERLSVAEAAEALGVTRDAIHKRINRGTIEHEKGEDGRFYVFVDTSTEGLGASTDMSVDKSKVEALERLIDSQHDRIAFLERELDRRGDETTRLHHIVAGLTQANAQLSARVPELEASQEATDAAETVEAEPEGTEPRSAEGEAQEELATERARREMAETTMHEGMTEERRRREAAERERDDLREQVHARSRQQGAHETAEEQQGRGQPQSATGGAQEGARRPWWRRVFGGRTDNG